jgi:uracil permease
MATGKAGDQQVVPYGTALSVAAISLLATMLTAIRAKRLLKLVPILVGVAVGYVVSLPRHCRFLQGDERGLDRHS